MVNFILKLVELVEVSNLIMLAKWTFENLTMNLQLFMKSFLISVILKFYENWVVKEQIRIEFILYCFCYIEEKTVWV